MSLVVGVVVVVAVVVVAVVVVVVCLFPPVDCSIPRDYAVCAERCSLMNEALLSKRDS